MIFQLVIVAQLMPQIVAAKHPVPAVSLSFVFTVFLCVFVFLSVLVFVFVVTAVKYS